MRPYRARYANIPARANDLASEITGGGFRGLVETPACGTTSSQVTRSAVSQRHIAGVGFDGRWHLVCRHSGRFRPRRTRPADVSARKVSAGMTSVPHDRSSASDSDPAVQPSRVHLKAATPKTDQGYVDGAWWPRSRDLATELPALFAALATRLGVIERMAYNLGEWQPAARRLDTGGVRVKLGGFHYQGANTVDVTGRDGRRVTLLVVPPGTPAATARKISLAAADERNVERTGTLLARVAGRNGMPRQRPAPQ